LISAEPEWPAVAGWGTVIFHDRGTALLQTRPEIRLPDFLRTRIDENQAW
jgi:hypothetical protein